MRITLRFTTLNWYMSILTKEMNHEDIECKTIKSKNQFQRNSNNNRQFNCFKSSP